MTCIKGHVLYEQGSPIDVVYFVKEGEFRIQQDVSMPKEVGGNPKYEIGQHLDFIMNQEKDKRTKRFEDN